MYLFNPLLTLVQGDEEELTRLLAESGVAERIEVDENGGRPHSCIANSRVLTFDSCGAPQPYSNWVLKAATAYGAGGCCLSIEWGHRSLESHGGTLEYYADRGSFQHCQRYPQNDQSQFPLVFC